MVALSFAAHHKVPTSVQVIQHGDLSLPAHSKDHVAVIVVVGVDMVLIMVDLHQVVQYVVVKVVVGLELQEMVRIKDLEDMTMLI